MKKRFTNKQIVAVLQRLERGEKAKDFCREIGFSSPRLYAWKQRFGGMEVGDVRRMKGLELENSRLKKLVANMALEIEILKNEWREIYNDFHPHRSLKGKTPKEFESEYRKQYLQPELLSS